MPAFSFSKQKKQPSFVKFDKQVPNVGKYNVSQTKFNSRVKTAPSVSLAKASRDSLQKKVVPGPGAYQTQTIHQNTASKGVSMKGSHYIKIKTEGPSPGQYSPQIEFPTKKFSFPKSLQKNSIEDGPDPGTYNVNYDVMNTTSNYAFSKAQRQPWDKRSWMKNVGPGYHDVKQKILTEQKNHFSFPKKQKFKEDIIQIKEKSIVPGPGKYDFSNARQSHKSVKFSLAAKTIAIKSEAPGPGAYSVLQKFLSATNSVTIGNSPREKDYKTIAPGPGAYQTQNIVKLKSRESANIVFPKQQRMKSATLTLNIGPGQYEILSEIDHLKKRNKGYSIKGRTLSQKVQQTPGPQAYNPDFGRMYTSCQRSIFGKQRKLSLHVNRTPGPGSYEPKQKLFAKTFYFNKAQQKTQDFRKHPSNIGPGQYKIKPLIGQFDGKDKLGIKMQTLYV